MLLSLHTAMEEFRNRYTVVGHGESGRMQPAVDTCCGSLLQPTASLRVECSASLRSGAGQEPRYWSASPASENKQQNTAGEV